MTDPTTSSSDLLHELLGTRLDAVLGVLVLWTLIGAFVVLLFSVVASWALKRMGAFSLAWKHAAWPRFLAIAWIVCAGTFIGGMAGLMEGGIRGGRIVLHEGKFRTDVLDPVGCQFAAALGSMDCLLQQAASQGGDVTELEFSSGQDAFLAQFREGKAELDVNAFLGRLGKVDEAIVDGLVGKALEKLKDCPGLEDGSMGREMLVDMLPVVVRWGIHEKAKGELDKLGVGGFVSRFMDGLPAAAASSGAPSTISFDELSRHTVDEGIVPAVEYPLVKFCRGKQLVMFLMLGGALLLPVLVFWLWRRIEQRRTVHRQAGV